VGVGDLEEALLLAGFVEVEGGDDHPLAPSRFACRAALVGAMNGSTFFLVSPLSLLPCDVVGLTWTDLSFFDGFGGRSCRSGGFL
jgi:hypothetical protein